VGTSKRLVVLGAATLAVAAAARGANVPIVIGVHPGPLTISAARSLSPQRVAITVTDARGSGAGWRLEVGSSSAVAVAHVGVRCAERSTCTLPRAVRLPASVAAGRRSVIVSAGKGQGMGRTEIVVDLGARPTGLAFTLRAG